MSDTVIGARHATQSLLSGCSCCTGREKQAHRVLHAMFRVTKYSCYSLSTAQYKGCPLYHGANEFLYVVHVQPAGNYINP